MVPRVGLGECRDVRLGVPRWPLAVAFASSVCFQFISVAHAQPDAARTLEPESSIPPIQVTEVPSTPIDAARALAYASQKAYDDGDYEEARAAASRAQLLVAAPTLALLEARALKKLGRYREAQTQYRWASAPLPPGASDAFHMAQASAQAELLALDDEMPQIYLALRDARSADVEASLDGLDLPSAALAVWLPVDPGVHEIRVDVGGVSE